MPKNLVIVESPAKARTIAKFLGKDFEVKSSFGHVRDLPKKELGVDIEDGFKPSYQISPDKKKVASELKIAAKDTDVWLASDEDREGEAIAWHICNILGLNPSQVKRIVFHEITKPAISAAVAKPRAIDMKLVDAQQARRVLDRLVGYELSPVLWKKVRAGLSAGRVQSVAVRLIVDREREIKAFQPEASFKVSAVFIADKAEVPADLIDKIADDKAAEELLQAAKKASFSISSIEQKPGTRSPSPPFTTSTLQQEAARRLGFSVKQTMTLAQRLYEEGHITYMRTDSNNLSSLAIDAATKYIKQQYGAKYIRPQRYKTRSAGAQEAHEAIRPTNVSQVSAGADSAQKKLYGLIWRRMVASQMAPAQVERTEVKIAMSGRSEQFLATGEVLKFDGFFKVYGGGKDDRLLPPLTKGQKLDLQSMTALQSFSRPPARYSEASLVRQLESLGIGRPSTYAPTISTIQDRDYVEKKDIFGEEQEVQQIKLENEQIKHGVEKIIVGADRSKLVPTELALVVTDFLVKYFGDIVDYDFTAKAEKALDDIEEGSLAWQKMIEDFYKYFHPLVEKSEKASRAEAAQARELGKDPKSGKPVIVRYGRYGPVLQLGEVDKDKDDQKAEKPRFAPLPTDATLEDVTLEQALPMFSLPREVGKTTDGQVITADVGRFGPYIKVGKDFTSIKDHDPLSITEAEARKVLAGKQKAEAERLIADFGQIKVQRGPYGPYVTDGKTNARIPKNQNPQKITEKKALYLLQKRHERQKSRFKQ